MYFKQFFDEKLAQYAYLIGCQANGTALIIDPMRDIDQYIDHAAKENLTIVAAADTHIHADYISGLMEFAERGVKVYASDEGDQDWKYEWLKGSRYDYELLRDGDRFSIGNIAFRAWHTPGHTPEHLSYFVTDGAASDEPMGVVTGDFVFVGDVGRPDLLESAAGQENMMEPSARTLYKTVTEFRDLPKYMQIWPGHGSGSACGKALGAIPQSTVGYELRTNNSLISATSEDAFVEFILEGQPEPPLYFARMKRDNKEGPSLIGTPPNPPRLSTQQISEKAKEKGVSILDTRERGEYAAGHVPGSLLSTLNRQFNTVAGSYITEDQEIVLLAEEHQLREAVLDLYRIGLDHISGFFTRRDLTMYEERGNELKQLKTTTFSELPAERGEAAVLDVRKASEYAESHCDGAIHIAHTRLLPSVGELDRSRRHYVYCQSGARSAVAASLLLRKGYDAVLVEDDFANCKPVQAA